MDPQWLQKAFDSDCPTVKIPIAGLCFERCFPISFPDEFLIVYRTEDYELEIEAKDKVILIIDGVEHCINLEHPNKNLTLEMLGKTISNAIAWRKDSKTGPEKGGELRIDFTDGSLMMFPTSKEKSAWKLDYKRDGIRSAPDGHGLEYAVHEDQDASE